ncbi:MAG: hypothetical protein B7Z47_06010 [Chthoniobacter sp. 12-60-6]|nr:MAG: hypothetical protein B7Z47_06010 [Chthoniobacter sp. 12-60-6]
MLDDTFIGPQQDIWLYEGINQPSVLNGFGAFFRTQAEFGEHLHGDSHITCRHDTEAIHGLCRLASQAEDYRVGIETVGHR